MKQRISHYALLVLVLTSHLIIAPVKADPGDIDIYRDKKILLGVGAGMDVYLVNSACAGLPGIIYDGKPI